VFIFIVRYKQWILCPSYTYVSSLQPYLHFETEYGPASKGWMSETMQLETCLTVKQLFFPLRIVLLSIATGVSVPQATILVLTANQQSLV
jgi:hypothetical protein